MNKLFILTLCALIFGAVNSDAAETKKLPEPDLNESSDSLLQIINSRQSERSYNTDKRVDDETLSQILWSARGVNQYGKITIPTARNNQDLKVFVLDDKGAWLYNAKANQLEKVSNKNMLPYLAEKQDFILNAPVHLVYTSSDKKWGFAHASSAYQNVYLFATAQGLSTVIRGLPNDAEMAKALNLAPDEFTIAHQPIGYSK